MIFIRRISIMRTGIFNYERTKLFRELAERELKAFRQLSNPNSVVRRNKQADYDRLAISLRDGLTCYNPKTGKTTYSTLNGTSVLEGEWIDSGYQLKKAGTFSFIPKTLVEKMNFRPFHRFYKA